LPKDKNKKRLEKNFFAKNAGIMGKKKHPQATSLPTDDCCMN
jgi:hypothetical protein